MNRKYEFDEHTLALKCIQLTAVYPNGGRNGIIDVPKAALAFRELTDCLVSQAYAIIKHEIELRGWTAHCKCCGKLYCKGNGGRTTGYASREILYLG